MNPTSVLLIAPAPPPYGGMALQAGQLTELLRQDGLHVIHFPSNFLLPGWLGPLRVLPGFRTLARAIWIWPKLWRQVGQVEVLHVLAASWLYFFLVVCPAVVVGRIRNKRVVLNYRGGAAGDFFRRFGWAVRPFIAAASVVTAPSNFLADVIRQAFRCPVTIVPNVVNLSIFQFRQRRFAQPRLLVTRHLEKIYDVESVLRAFDIIQRNHQDATLWIAGSGDQAGNLQSLSKTLGLRNVRFLGSVAHHDLPAIYEQCDIFINASRVDNFPGALLEASAAGLPIVSTCAGGIPYIYQNRKSALLSEPGDWQSLATSVEELLGSPSLTAQLSTAGAAIARQCDWAEVSNALYQVYGMSPVRRPAKIASLL